MIKRISARLHASILSVVLISGAVTWSAPGQAARSEDDKIVLNFVNADIPSVIKAVGELTGRNFVIDPRVKGTIIITSAKPVPLNLVYPILLSALRMQGYAAIEGPGATKIVPETEAKHSLKVTRGKQINESGDRIVTQVYPLQHESAAQLLPVLKPLVGPNNMISVLPSSNALIITDYADNLHRLNAIIEAVDQPVSSDAVQISLKHVSAIDLGQTLSRLITESNAATTDPQSRIVIVPDVRTNSLLVRSGNPSRIQMLRELAEKLDSPGAQGGGIHVVYLRNADAKKLAETLRGILAGSPLVAPTAQPAQNAAQVAISGGGDGSMVIADQATNSLVINAPDHTYNMLRAVIDKLDARRAQVYVEALVVEVTAEKAAEFGIQWQDLGNINDSGTNFIGGTNFGAKGSGTNIIDVAVNPTNAGRGLNVGVVSGTVTIPGIGTITNLGMLARALETDADANILSTPNLLTLDNEEAKIVIGQNVPFVTGQYAQTGSATTATPFQTIERRDVGLTLKVKPQVSEGGTVRMQIYQEMSSLRPTSTTTQTADVITDKRSIESVVLVEDGRIIALGGLIEDTWQDSIDKVPLLGDMPLFGHLFRSESRTRKKTNLMVFLRPHVLRDADSGLELSQGRYEYIRNRQVEHQMQPHFAMPEFKMDMLPELRPPTK